MPTAEHSVVGTLKGKVITLEQGLPALDGQRVRLLVEPADEIKLDAEEQAGLWEHWVARGPQGPIEDNDDPEFP